MHATARGDPVEDDVKIEDHHCAVLVEGNYLLLPQSPWVRRASYVQHHKLRICTDALTRKKTKIGSVNARLIATRMLDAGPVAR